MKLAQFARADEGQALVIVGIAMMALIAGMALTLDWGYGYVQRRGIQNAMDNAALAAARHVASTFRLVSGTPTFDATLEEICADVATRTSTLSGPSAISFFSDPDDEGTWTTIATNGCSAGAGVAVPDDTVFVRVRSVSTVRSLTQQTFAIAASARARLVGTAACDDIDCTALRPLSLPSSEQPGVGVSGYTTGPNVAIWPLALHLDLAEFQGSPCGQYCDPTLLTTDFHLWEQEVANEYGPTEQRFTGLITFTHFSTREGSQFHQLSTESDYTGTTDLLVRSAHAHSDTSIYPSARMPDLVTCNGAAHDWDTLGSTQQIRLNGGMWVIPDATSCDLPNWFGYGFRGSMGVGTDWRPSGSWSGFETAPGIVDVPEALPTDPALRSSCDRSFDLSRPSCAGGPNRLGDWIETVPGDLTTEMATQMRAFVAKYGRVVPYSSTPISTAPGAPLLGRAVVVFIPLWDCAEEFDASLSGSARWQLIVPASGDCSQLAAHGGQTVDRVHIVAIAPFTVYEGFIATGPTPHVHAVWGDVFGDAGTCRDDPLAAGCALNQFMNSAYLVPDE